MMNRLLLAFTVGLCCVLSTAVVAFQPAATRSRLTSTTALAAQKPKLDKQSNRWEKAKDDDGVYPYGPFGSLLRHGPSPFFTRLTNADEYEQAVLKYMATAGVSRAEATGNMDAKLNNAMDWSYQKRAERNGSPKVDYTVLNKKDAALAIIWALGITPLTIQVIYQTVTQF